MKRWFVGIAIILALGILLFFPSPSSPSTNILLITIDTLRPDHLGCYGYSRSTSPHLDALAREGALFEEAVVQSCFTAPSMASFASSRFPLSHGVMDWKFFGKGCPGPTAGEAMRSLGYRTVFLGGHGALHTLSPLRRGFQVFDDAEGRGAEEIASLALKQLHPNGKRPFFMWLHFFDPHGPYTPPPPFTGQFLETPVKSDLEGVPESQWLSHALNVLPEEKRDSFLISQYDGEIAYVDREVGRIVERLKEGSLWKKTVLLITSDHGENLNEKNLPGLNPFDHRNYLFDTLIKVPLIFTGGPLEWAREKKIALQVQSIDILPTLFHLIGRPWTNPSWQGKTLLPLLESLSRGGQWAFSDSGYQEVPHKAVRGEGWKLTLKCDSREYKLYRLSDDPGETSPVLGQGEVLKRLQGVLKGWLDSLPKESLTFRGRLDPAQEVLLKRLGYLQ